MTVIVPMRILADGRPLSEAGEGSYRSEVPCDEETSGTMKMLTDLFVVLQLMPNWLYSYR